MKEVILSNGEVAFEIFWPDQDAPRLVSDVIDFSRRSPDQQPKYAGLKTGEWVISDFYRRVDTQGHARYTAGESNRRRYSKYSKR